MKLFPPSFFSLHVASISLLVSHASYVTGFVSQPVKPIIDFGGRTTNLDGATWFRTSSAGGVVYGNINTEKYMLSRLKDILLKPMFGNWLRKQAKKKALEEARRRAMQYGIQYATGKVVDLATDKIVDQIDGLSPSSERILKDDLDNLHVAFNAAVAAGALEQQQQDISEHEFSAYGSGDKKFDERFDIGWKRTGRNFDDWEKGFIPAEMEEVSNDVFVKRIRTDAFLGSPSALGDAQAYITGSKVLFPVTDKVISFASKDERVQLLEDLRLNSRDEGGVSPPIYSQSGDFTTSDETFSRFFFHGLGAALLEQQQKESTQPALGSVEIDIDFMKDIPVREDFRPMGVKLYFDNDQKATGIYDSHKQKIFKPGDDGWEGAKFLARSSAFTLLTAREHLFQTHLLVSNYFSYSSIKHLPPNHPIRRLINVFTFRTNFINDFAFNALVPDARLLHRSTGFEYDGMITIFINAFTNSNAWQPFPKRNMRPELLDMSSNGKLPYHSEAIEYYKIVEDFVRDWLDNNDAAVDNDAIRFYNEIRDSTIGQKYELPEFEGLESMVDLISQAIFMVTCYHEIIGTVIDYTSDPTAVSFRVRKDTDDGNTGTTENDVQSYIYTIIITAGTGAKVPMLMDRYGGYFGRDGAPWWERRKWSKFQNQLRKQSRKVRRSDRKKDAQFLFFDPKRFESSVSV